MSGLERLEKLITGVVCILFGITIFFEPDSYIYVIYALALMLGWNGIRSLVFYANMARFMVGGRTMLYKGVLYFDLMIFSISLVFESGSYSFFILFYLIAYHAFSGIVDILRAFEAKGYRAPGWKFKMASGALNLAIAVACIVFYGNMSVVITFYAVGMCYTGVACIITGFHRTKVVYIQ